MYLYFYCEWLDSDLVYKYLPDARFITIATLKDHKVSFVSFKEDVSDETKHGGCIALESPGEILYGTLYEVTEKEVEHVDKLTRVDEGRYIRKNFTVNGEDGKTYEAVAHSIKNPIDRSKPSKEYMDHMIRGAKEFNFTEEYIVKLEKLR